MTSAGEASVGGLDVSRETFATLQAYEALVRRWNPAINLVSQATLSDFWTRHVVDSAQLFALAPTATASWVDLGSGGGLPGLVAAVLAKQLRPEMKVTLVESDLRKATFLRQAAQSLALPVQVYSKRIESLPPMAADVLSARALAPLPHLLAFADSHLAIGGVALFPKGERYAEELKDAHQSWSFDVDVRPSLSDAKAAILVIRNIHRVQD
jgi:16S rRNA (guanine527-N7)-methyltransferase